MYWTKRREKFRALMEGNRCVNPGSVYDAVSAHIAAHVGYPGTIAARMRC